MRTYILTSTGTSGQVEYTFDEADYLIAFKFDAIMTDSQRTHILRRMPLTRPGLESLEALSPNITITELDQDISFDAFWNAYNKKINRKRCEPLWAKLKDSDKVLCLASIKPYKRYLHRTNFRAQKDPDGYLRDRLFETEWNKLN